jgi:hypothetical protein
MRKKVGILFVALALVALIGFNYCESKATNMTAYLIKQGWDEINIPAEVDNNRLQLKNAKTELEIAQLEGKQLAAYRKEVDAAELTLSASLMQYDLMLQHRPHYLESEAEYDTLKLYGDIYGIGGLLLLVVGILFLVWKSPAQKQPGTVPQPS